MPDAQFDNKGKIFTDVISKESVTAVIQTVTHQIRGFVHVRPGERRDRVRIRVNGQGEIARGRRHRR